MRMSLLRIGILLLWLGGRALAQQTEVLTGDQIKQDQQKPEEEEKKPKGVIHLQEVKDVPQVHAHQACNNYSWTASLEVVLTAQKVDLKQEYWADRYYGGDLCLEEMGSPDDLIKKAEGDYTLDDGRHVKIEMQYFAGLPSNTSAFLVPIMNDELVILFVDGKAAVLTGAMWDDYLSNRGERMIDLKELHLLDPLQEPDKEKVIIESKPEDLSKITGFMKVKAAEVNTQYWPK